MEVVRNCVTNGVVGSMIAIAFSVRTQDRCCGYRSLFGSQFRCGQGSGAKPAAIYGICVCAGREIISCLSLCHRVSDLVRRGLPLLTHEFVHRKRPDTVRGVSACEEVPLTAMRLKHHAQDIGTTA